MKKNNTLLLFKDIIPNKNSLDTFHRVILNKSGQQEYYFEKGKLTCKLINKATPYLKQVKTEKNIINKFITMDIESRQIKNKATPYLIAFFDGIQPYVYFLSDFKNREEMARQACLELLKSKYDQHKIYFHNLSYFDSVFILNTLHSLANTNLSIMLHEGKFINLKLNYGKSKKKYTINFRDSLLMLPVALADIAKSFKIKGKELFPVFAPNDYDLNYVGKVPPMRYFKDISLQDYITYARAFLNNN